MRIARILEASTFVFATLATLEMAQIAQISMNVYPPRKTIAAPWQHARTPQDPTFARAIVGSREMGLHALTLMSALAPTIAARKQVAPTRSVHIIAPAIRVTPETDFRVQILMNVYSKLIIAAPMQLAQIR